MRQREFKNIICRAVGCERVSHLKGFCDRHYLRFRRHGHEGITHRLTDIIDRYWYGIIDIGDDCWLWAGTVNHSGYPVMSVNCITTLVHIWTYKYFFGDFPKGIEIDHICENVACVNPLHLQLLTHDDNCLKRDRRPYQQFICDSMPEQQVLDLFVGQYGPPKFNPINYCKVSGCNIRCHGLGYCQTHYTAFKRHGDPLYKKEFEQKLLNLAQ